MGRFGVRLAGLFSGFGIFGNERPNYWAIPIINFVFWAGVALSGTMISAILRLVHAGWRRSLTRMTETLTLCALAVAGIFPLQHLGRNWVFYLASCPIRTSGSYGPTIAAPCFGTPRRSSVYLITSFLFWYSGLIPDFAVLRDRTMGWRRINCTVFYRFGWRGTDREWRRLKTLSAIPDRPDYSRSSFRCTRLSAGTLE